MFSINKALGMVPNASEEGYLVDQFLEMCHWFMALLFIGWSCYFVYTLWRFSRARNPRADYHGVHSKASAHLEFSVIVIEAGNPRRVIDQNTYELHVEPFAKRSALARSRTWTRTSR